MEKKWGKKYPIASFAPVNKKKEILYIENNEENRESICLVLQFWNATKMHSEELNILTLYSDILKSLSLDPKFPQEKEAFDHFMAILKKNKISNNPFVFTTYDCQDYSWKSIEDIEKFEIENGEKFPNSRLLRNSFHRALQYVSDCPKDSFNFDPTIQRYQEGDEISFKELEEKEN